MVKNIQGEKPHLTEIQLPKLLQPNCTRNNIQLGGKSDGSYVINRDVISQSEMLISCGLSEDWRFETEFLDIKSKINLQAYDHTLNTQWLLKNFSKNLLKFILNQYTFSNLKLSLIALLTYSQYFNKINRFHFREKIVGESKNFGEVTLTEAFARALNLPTFLKIDIEESEYEVLEQISKNKIQITGLAIEFHNLAVNRSSFENFVVDMQPDFHINNININNFGKILFDGYPDVIEISFSKCNIESCQGNEIVPEIRCNRNNPSGPVYLIKFCDV